MSKVRTVGEFRQALADRFVSRLKLELGAEKFKQMQKLNDAEANPDICYSHDFCDANMTMLEAYATERGITDSNEIDVGDDAVIEEFNRAWEKAKQQLRSRAAKAPKLYRSK